MRARHLVRILAVALAVMAGAQTALAQTSEAEREQAREGYAQGQALFLEGKYLEARAVFQGTYDLIPNPIVLLSMAECDVRLGKIEDAVTELERYLAERPDAADRPSIEAKLVDLRAMPTVLVLTSTPAGASIRLDGVDTGEITPAEITIERGEHTVEVLLAGHDAASTKLTAKLGSREEIELVLPALPPPPPPEVAVVETPAEAPPKRVDEPPTTALWVSGIVGGVGLVTGTVLGILALGEKSDFDAHPTEASADRGERLALFADVSFGVGVMAIVTGVVLLLTDAPAAKDDAAAKAGATEPRLALAPVVGRDRAAVAAALRF